MKRYNFEHYKSVKGWVIRFGFLVMCILMVFGFITLVKGDFMNNLIYQLIATHAVLALTVMVIGGMLVTPQWVRENMLKNLALIIFAMSALVYVPVGLLAFIWSY